MSKPIFLIIFILIYYCGAALAQDVDCQVSVETVNSHVGETVAFCGQVTDVSQPSRVNGNPIFLNFGGKYPNHTFTVVVWKEVCKTSESFILTLRGKDVIVKGRITEYKEKLQIELSSDKGIKLFPVFLSHSSKDKSFYGIII